MRMTSIRVSKIQEFSSLIPLITDDRISVRSEIENMESIESIKSCAGTKSERHMIMAHIIELKRALEAG
jgi:hypothetical protein